MARAEWVAAEEQQVARGVARARDGDPEAACEWLQTRPEHEGHIGLSGQHRLQPHQRRVSTSDRGAGQHDHGRREHTWGETAARLVEGAVHRRPRR
jgi:hypothetical protein